MFALLIPAIVYLALRIVKKVSPSIKETARLYNTTKSPIVGLLGETIHGVSTIRAFDRSEVFISEFNELQNENVLAMQMMLGMNGWFAINVNFLSLTIIAVICLICAFMRDQANIVTLALLLDQIQGIQDLLINILNYYMAIQVSMVNFNRCI